MTNYFFKNFFCFAFLSFILGAIFIFGANFSFAEETGEGVTGSSQVDDKLYWGGDSGDTSLGKEKIGEAAGLLEQKDPRLIVASIIRIILGFLGIITVVLIMAGGFKWMMSQGNQEEIKTAKEIIKNGVIGLAIVLSSYAIAEFVIRSFIEVAKK